jgi:hypothetical protein
MSCWFNGKWKVLEENMELNYSLMVLLGVFGKPEII